MRRRFLGRSIRQVYPLRQCHFCNTQSYIVPPHPSSESDVVSPSSSPSSHNNEIAATTSSSSSSMILISTGTESNWYCSSCQCWNRADANEIGGVSSWEIKMSDEKQNLDDCRKRAVSTSSITTKQKSIPTISPFCHSCQTNQLLILSILANGDTDAMSNEEVIQWQLSLEDRYPPVCNVCQEMVKIKIEKADKVARRLIWNDWLKKSKERKVSNASSSILSSNHQAHIESSISKYDSSSLPFTWYMQLLSYLSSLLVSALGIWYRPAIGTRQHSSRLAALVICYLISRNWNPSLPRQLRLKRRLSPNSHIKVECLSEFKRAQTIIFLMQIADQFDIFEAAQSFKGIEKSGYTFYTAVLLNVLQVFIAISALRVVKVIEPPSISLKTRIPSVNPNLKQSKLLSEPLLQGLTLNPEYSSTTDQSSKEASLRETIQQENGQNWEEIEMDWTPTPDASITRFNHDFKLGPQRFFEPLRHTGLEDMLDKTLALGEVIGKPGKSSHPGRSKLRLLIFVSIVTSIVIVGLVYYFLDALPEYKLQKESLSAWLQKYLDNYRLRATPPVHTINDQINVN